MESKTIKPRSIISSIHTLTATNLMLARYEQLLSYTRGKVIKMKVQLIRALDGTFQTYYQRKGIAHFVDLQAK